MKIFIGVAVIGIVMLVVFGWLFGESIGKRLIKLKDSLSILANGNFNQELDSAEIKKEDEVGEIYRSLNIMIDSIKDIVSGVKNNVQMLKVQADTLGESSEHIKVGSKDISAVMDETAQANTSQAQQLLEANTNMNQFGDNINTMNMSIDELVQISEVIEKQVDDSNKNIGQLQSVVRNFENSFNMFSEQVQKMNEKTSSIGNITSSIESIAEQTQMLALNAAIEAARAGEAGKGFSVVAEEVRKLADESKKSVSEIGSIIKSILDECQNIIESTEHINSQVTIQKGKIEGTVESFNKITNGLEEITPKIADISKASEEINTKKKGIINIVENASAAAEEVSASTDEVAATSSEFQGTVNEIEKVSEKILDSISELKEKIDKFIIE